MKAQQPILIADALDEMEFKELGSFNDGHMGVFWSSAGGPSPWEMHPETDELLHVLEGEIDVEILPLDAGEGTVTRVAAGGCCIVPRGCWHRQTLLVRSKELYVTPGTSLHSNEADPRTEAPLR